MQISVLGFLARFVLAIGALALLVFWGSADAVRPEDYGLREGDLIRAVNDPDIYIVNDHGYKRLFLNPVIFGFYGHLKWENVREVSPATRDTFITSGYFRNCENGDVKVHAAEITGEDVGVFHWLNMTAEGVLAEDADFSKKVFCINNSEYNWYGKSAHYTSIAQLPRYDRKSLAAPTKAPTPKPTPTPIPKPIPTPTPSVSTPVNPFFGKSVPCKKNVNPAFNTAIADAEKLKYIVPPGSPSGDKIASHTYLIISEKGTSVPIYAPADSTLIEGSFGVDYGLTLQVSCEVIYVLGHFTEPVQKIKDAVSAKKDPILMDFKEGELLGYTSGTVEAGGFDFGVYHISHANSFVNQARYTRDNSWSKDNNAVCPYDYFPEPIKSSYYAKFGSIGGKLVPGASCRSASQDVAGSISGAWYETKENSNVMAQRLVIGLELTGDVIRIGATNPAGFRFPFIFSDNATFKKPSEVTQEHCYSHSYGNDNQIAYFKVISNIEMDAYFSSATSTCPSAIPTGAKRYYR